MGEKIVVGPVNKGFKNDRTAFVIDNDSFPTLINAYQWRGRVKRKRGTSLLGRLRRFFDSLLISYNPVPPGTPTQVLDGTGSGNLLTGFTTLEADANLVPGSIIITDGATTYTDPASDGILVGNPAGSGIVNYATGAFTIAGGAANIVSATFTYYPTLPVMGLEELFLRVTQNSGNLFFDTKYSYNVLTSDPFDIYDVSFYKNPVTGTYPGYIEKTDPTPTTWNGEDYQQFATINYEGALWATNGLTVPFDITKVGMQFKFITGAVINAAGPPALVTLTIVAHGLVQGDFLFINEIIGMTGINFQTGYVVSADPQAANTVQVEFPDAAIGGAYASGGIAQYLTNRSDPTIDCIRWYDGDPTDGNPTAPTLNGTNGWVNFMPPLSQRIFSIADLPRLQYYLVGAKTLINFKDRLLFLGPVVQASGGIPIYLQDTVVYSQNGTPYYTASFEENIADFVTDPLIAFTPILVPQDQTATPSAWFEDQTGFGGYISAGISSPITTVSANEDVLIVGLSTLQTRIAYTGNDIVPFNFFLINSELGSSSTFSAINLDKGVFAVGSRGYTTTNQYGCQRIDLEIPDEIFEINLQNNGAERVTAGRDFINEWIYFTFPGNEISYVFPNQTLQYNYRDNSWGLFFESYTTYGIFKKRTGFIWSTVGRTFPTWSSWNEPWNAGSSTLLQPLVIGGNQQGFVMFRDDGTNEATSLQIQSFSVNTVTSPNHGLNNDDFIIISGALGTVGQDVNGKIFQVFNTTADTFDLNPTIVAGTYLGLGVIRRMYKPLIQTKQFPTAWAIGRKTRLGAQQYLFTTTENAQIQLLIFLSQDGDSPYNEGPIVPSFGTDNDTLIYSTVLYTCPESTNLGLTPANVNINMPTAIEQDQTWHRMNTSLIGDTVQIGFTLSDEQMRSLSASAVTFAITGATQTNPAVLASTANYDPNTLVLITGVVGMTELNGNIYRVISSTTTNVTIEEDATGFTAYISGGTIVKVFSNQFAEIELHGFILDVNQSQLLV